MQMTCRFTSSIIILFRKEKLYNSAAIRSPLALLRYRNKLTTREYLQQACRVRGITYYLYIFVPTYIVEAYKYHIHLSSAQHNTISKHISLSYLCCILSYTPRTCVYIHNTYGKPRLWCAKHIISTKKKQWFSLNSLVVYHNNKSIFPCWLCTYV